MVQEVDAAQHIYILYCNNYSEIHFVYNVDMRSFAVL
jgi:hypothetical protein